jgi:site-specific recombinase XerC
MIVAWALTVAAVRMTMLKGAERAQFRPRRSKDLEFHVKQHLAAIHILSDWLVVRQVVEINPAAAVRGPKPKHVKKGKTPILEADEARQLIDGINVSTPVGLRDRALIAMLIYTFARGSRRGDWHQHRGLLRPGSPLVGAPSREGR